MSQRDQILKRLREAGDRGVFSFHLLDITPRYAARICELNQLGYEVSSVPEKSSEAIGVRYTLVGLDQGVPGGPALVESGESSVGQPPKVRADQGARPSSPAADTAPPDLFSVEPTRRAPSMFDPFSDAA